MMWGLDSESIYIGNRMWILINKLIILAKKLTKNHTMPAIVSARIKGPIGQFSPTLTVG